MRFLRLAIPATLSFLVVVLVVDTYRSQRGDFYLGGIQVNEADHVHWVETLERSGMNTVAVTVYAHQGDWDSSNLWFEDDEPWVIHEVREAKRQGLKVVLVLRVALDHAFERNRFFWHGMIMPATDDDLQEWFSRYRGFARKWARVAQDEGIDVLAVASELNSLTNTLEIDSIPSLEEYWSNSEKVELEDQKVLAHEDEIERRHLWAPGGEAFGSLDSLLDEKAREHGVWARAMAYLDEPDPLTSINARRKGLRENWARVISEVRQEFEGQLTYAANFDQYHMVAFWDRLDLMGINAYFPLRRRQLPASEFSQLEPLLEARWKTILESILEFQDDQNLDRMRVLFTELGYVRRANSTIEPWAASGFSVLPSDEGTRLMIWEDQPTERRERAAAVAGLYKANRSLGGDLLAGILYWKLSTEPAHEEEEPFVLIIGDRAPEDPLLEELQRFRWRRPIDEWLRRVGQILGFLHRSLINTQGHAT
jgi:hypothetical protein